MNHFSKISGYLDSDFCEYITESIPGIGVLFYPKSNLKFLENQEFNLEFKALCFLHLTMEKMNHFSKISGDILIRIFMSSI